MNTKDAALVANQLRHHILELGYLADPNLLSLTAHNPEVREHVMAANRTLVKLAADLGVVEGPCGFCGSN